MMFGSAVMLSGYAAMRQSVYMLRPARMIFFQSFLFSIAISGRQIRNASTFAAASYVKIHSRLLAGHRALKFNGLKAWNQKTLLQSSKVQLWQCSARFQIRLTQFIYCIRTFGLEAFFWMTPHI
jgi:hypothetical protein